jgi:hypothetical protein
VIALRSCRSVCYKLNERARLGMATKKEKAPASHRDLWPGLSTSNQFNRTVHPTLKRLRNGQAYEGHE